MMTVQATLQKQYAANVRITAKSVSGVQGTILNVTLVNAPLMDRINIEGPDGRQAALEVAAAARDILPAGRGYNHADGYFADGASCQPVFSHCPFLSTNASVAMPRSLRVCPPLCRSISYDV